MTLLCLFTAQAQTQIEGSCGENVKWVYDGYTLIVSNTNKNGIYMPMDDYDLNKNMAPWRKKGLDIRRVLIESGITSVGACAFAGCENLTEVVFNSAMSKIRPSPTATTCSPSNAPPPLYSDTSCL